MFTVDRIRKDYFLHYYRFFKLLNKYILYFQEQKKCYYLKEIN